MRHSALLYSVMLLTATPAMASTVSVHVIDGGGKPAREVVVTLRPIGKASPEPKPVSGYQVNQKDTQFHPFISVVPVGSSVSFPNLDPFKHHVYSFSAAKRFELKLFAKDQTRSILFDKPGVVAIGCNIHDSMSAFLYVTDTAFTASTDASGQVRIPAVPAAHYTLGIWHPYLNAPANQQSVEIAVGRGDHSESVTVRFRPPPMHNMSGY
jgi:plastocyanin